jgi:hypothetical protein
VLRPHRFDEKQSGGRPSSGVPAAAAFRHCRSTAWAAEHGSGEARSAPHPALASKEDGQTELLSRSPVVYAEQD